MKCPGCEYEISAGQEECPKCGFRFTMERLERVIPLLKRPMKTSLEPSSTLQRIKGTFISPALTFWNISQIPDKKGLIFVLVLNALLLSLNYPILWTHINITGSEAFIGTVNLHIWGSFAGLFLTGLGILLLAWVLIVFAFWSISRVTGGKGSYRVTFLVTSYAFIPLIIARLISLAILAVGLPSVTIGETMGLAELEAALLPLFNSMVWTYSLGVETFFWLWSALLSSLAIRETQNTSTLKALVIAYVVIICSLLILWMIH
ncbi:MAG: YIP1 family protein [Candidatus Hodarchaeota archaeon]